MILELVSSLGHIKCTCGCVSECICPCKRKLHSKCYTYTPSSHCNFEYNKYFYHKSDMKITKLRQNSDINYQSIWCTLSDDSEYYRIPYSYRPYTYRLCYITKFDSDEYNQWKIYYYGVDTSYKYNYNIFHKFHLVHRIKNTQYLKTYENLIFDLNVVIDSDNIDMVTSAIMFITLCYDNPNHIHKYTFRIFYPDTWI
jgi:hypothetical protein